MISGNGVGDAKLKMKKNKLVKQRIINIIKFNNAVQENAAVSSLEAVEI